MSADAFFNKLFRKGGFENNPFLTQALWLISDQGKTAIDLTPVSFMGLMNVATDASFDVFPFTAGETYFIMSGAYSKYSITQTGLPLIDYYDPFTNVIKYRYGGSSAPNNTVTVNYGIGPVNYLTSRIRWNDNGATVGTFSLMFDGF